MSALSAKIPVANPFSDETVMLPMMFSLWPDFVMEFAKIPVASAPPETSKLSILMFSSFPAVGTGVSMPGAAIMPVAVAFLALTCISDMVRLRPPSVRWIPVALVYPSTVIASAVKSRLTLFAYIPVASPCVLPEVIVLSMSSPPTESE